MRIKKSELIRIIRESFDVINSETGEITDHAPHADAVFNIMKRLGISPDPNEGMPGAQEVYLTNDDWMKFDKETWGKSHKRKEKADKIRTDIKNVLPKLDQWAADAGEQYIADNPDVDLGGVARDLAAGAEYSFEKDEWISLLKYFKWDDDALLSYITGQIRSPAQNEGKIRIRKSDLRRIIKEEQRDAFRSRGNALPSSNSNWYAFAKGMDIGVLDLGEIAYDLGFADFYDMDISITPAALAKRDPNKFLTAVRDHSGLADGKDDTDILQLASHPSYVLPPDHPLQKYEEN